MNYSDYDSDGYSSNEDADYVPSGEDCKHYGEVSAIQWRKRRTDTDGYWWLSFPVLKQSMLKLRNSSKATSVFWLVSIQLFSHQIKFRSRRKHSQNNAHSLSSTCNSAIQ